MWHKSAEILFQQILKLSIKAIWWRTLDWSSLDKIVDWNGSLARISGLKLSDFKINLNHSKCGHFWPNNQIQNNSILSYFYFLIFNSLKNTNSLLANRSAEKDSFLTKNSQNFQGQKF